VLNWILSELKKVLLSGSTSFVGGAAAACLLSSTETEIVAVVRAQPRATVSGASTPRSRVSA